MRNHMERCHTVALAQTAPSRTMSSDAGMKRPRSIDIFLKKMTCSAQRAVEITDSIVNFVALDLRPMSIVNGVGFCHLLHTREPGYRVPSHTQIASLLQRKHAHRRNKNRESFGGHTASQFCNKHVDEQGHGRLLNGYDYIRATIYFELWIGECHPSS